MSICQKLCGVVGVTEEYEYIRIVEVEKKPKTSVYQVINKRYGDVLGIIRWHGPWRRYILDIQEQTLWNDGCLKEVTGFMVGLKLGRKLVKIDIAIVCMNCFNISEINNIALSLWLLSDVGSEVCTKCNHKDLRIFQKGVQIYPKKTVEDKVVT